MPRITPFRLAAVCALALSMFISCTALAAAKGPRADLRVVGSGGKVLAEKTVVSAPVSVKTSPKATCFGPGTGGSGDKVALKANTAMGLLAAGSLSTPALRPLSISDHFDFGLALCGIGKSVAKGTASWYLKINHKSLQVGGEVAKIKPGDEVLWTLASTEAPDYTYPEELVLTAPGKVKAGQEFTVRAWTYDEKGKRKPAANVTVSRAAEPTDASGRVTLMLRKPAKLIARGKGDIPSARVPVCVGGKCPK